MAINRPSRHRPLRWLALVAAATLVILIANAGLHAKAGRAESELAYFDQVRPEITGSTNQGADVADVRANAAGLGRLGVSHQLTRLGQEADDALKVVSALVPPANLQVAQAYLVTAFGARARAVAEMGAAMSIALSTGPPDAAVADLVQAGQGMALGDQAYQLYLASLPGKPGPALPASAWVTDPSLWIPPEVSAFVSSLRASISLTPIHDLAVVTFTTDPAPVGIQNGAEVLPPTKGLQVALVIADVGNQPERDVKVTAALFTAGMNTTETVQDFLDLVPGGRRAIEIGSLHPVSGTTGTLTVTVVPVPGETNVADNTQQWSLVLR